MRMRRNNANSHYYRIYSRYWRMLQGLASTKRVFIFMENKNDITMNDLALMVGRGFNAVDKRFDAVDRTLFDMDQRLQRIEKTILEDYGNRIEIKKIS